MFTDIINAYIESNEENFESSYSYSLYRDEEEQLFRDMLIDPIPA